MTSTTTMVELSEFHNIQDHTEQNREVAGRPPLNPAYFVVATLPEALQMQPSTELMQLRIRSVLA